MIKNHNKVVLLYSLKYMHKGSLDEKVACPLYYLWSIPVNEVGNAIKDSDTAKKIKEGK